MPTGFLLLVGRMTWTDKHSADTRSENGRMLRRLLTRWCILAQEILRLEKHGGHSGARLIW
jgi:hypothetical protein